MPNSNLLFRTSLDPAYENRLQNAKSLISSVTHIIALFPAAIRAVVTASTVLKTEDSNHIRDFSVRCIYPTIKVSPTLSKYFELAANELYPSHCRSLKTAPNTNVRDYLTLMTPNEIIAVLGITYFYKLLHKNVDKEELHKLTPLLSRFLKNGAIIGTQLAPSFGRGGGMIASALPILGLACLIKSNLKSYKSLRRLIDDTGSLEHAEFELENFKCTHLDVASVLAGELGFGPIAREAFILAQSDSTVASNPQIIFWLHTLKQSKELWHSGIENPNAKKKNALNSVNCRDGYNWLFEGISSALVPDSAVDQEMPKTISRSERTINTTESVKSTEEFRILLVEDDSASNKILSRMVAPLGHVSSYLNAEEAAETLISALPYNLIFLDIGLPGKSGLALLNEIRALEQQLGLSEQESPIILMLTGDGSAETVVKAFSDGADGYLTKPFKKEEIRDELVKFGIDFNINPKI
jgi:CheY-like chemotaxis protein